MCCRLASFPVAACGLALSLLDLTDNNLAQLPPQLGRMTSLRALPLSGNPLRGLRTGQPLSALLRSLRNRMEQVCCCQTNLTSYPTSCPNTLRPSQPGVCCV